MTAPSTPRTTLPQPPESHHRDIQGGAARAAVLGVSDGLVTNVSLILGVAGANPAPGTIRLAGLAGLLAGAFSMAAGEYVSMKAQTELLERELEMERVELRRAPDAERAELAQLYESRGVDPDVAGELAHEMMRTPELALETHAREELGVDPRSLGNPYQAAGASAASFGIGAVVPLMPWFFTHGTAAVLISIVLGAAAAVCIGVALARYTGRSWVHSAVRQLIVTVAAAGVTYALGALVGTHLG
jgi:VIT1/CCC1 family predicted Fe2+/Mn2+ transporter